MRVSFSGLAEDMLNDYRVNSKKSADRVEQAIHLHLRPYFGDTRIPQITSAKIQEYINMRLEEHAKKATINRELAYLKRMLRLGNQQTPPKVDRVPQFQMLRENNTRKGFFEAEEFTRFLVLLPEYLRGFVTFAYRTGWRRGKIRNLTWDRVDRTKGIVRLEAGETKNGEARTVYLDPELKELINKQFKDCQSGCPYVFHVNGKPIGEFKKSWATALRKAGVTYKTFHDFRRTAVRNMLRSGTSERVVMMISGHRTRSVFDRYNIVSDEDLMLAAQRQSDYLGKKG